MKRRLICLCRGHRDLVFVRNIYGDEIIACGYKRSVWRCGYCDGYVLRPQLVDESGQAASARERAS